MSSANEASFQRRICHAPCSGSSQGELVPELDRYFDPELPLESEEEWEEEVDRKSAEYVLWIQRSLNRKMAAGLNEDGIAGPRTKAAVVRFQRLARLDADGIVGPATEAALVKAGAGPPPTATSVPSTPAAWAPPTTGATAPAVGERGANVFGRAFKADATGRSDVNAYLLTYLATMVYADRGIQHVLPEHRALEDPGACTALERQLQTDEYLFRNYFIRHTQGMFYDAGKPASAANAAPRYEYVTMGTRDDEFAKLGIARDPEAMIIGTSSAVFVVFRGTDRIATATEESDNILSRLLPDAISTRLDAIEGQVSDFGYSWGEWIVTDAIGAGTSPGYGMRGKVHSGMWSSLLQIVGKVTNKVIEFGGASKPVWVTGHSLGGAQALLFSAFLAASGIKPRGTYAIAAPRVGDQEFVNDLHSRLPRESVQRFEFVDDLVTMIAPRRAEIPPELNEALEDKIGTVLAPRVIALVNLLAAAAEFPDYYHPGIRNYYDDVTRYAYSAPERSTNAVAAVLGKLVSRDISPFCFHHPWWYLGAAYRQLDAATQAIVPLPLELPTACDDACNDAAVARGLGPA